MTSLNGEKLKPFPVDKSQWRKTEAISCKVKNERRVSTLITLIHYSLWIPSQSNSTREKICKGLNKEEKVKLYLLAGNMIFYLKDPKIFNKKPLIYHKHF
jgi:hypothetical protein